MLVFQVLTCLVRIGPRTQNELANATAQHPAGICRLLSDLEGAELVRRKRDSQDMRKVQVAMTAKGRSLLNTLKPIVSSAAERVFAPLSESERRTLAGLLEKVLDTEVTVSAPRPRAAVAASRRARRAS
jgi:DNA-binding MarR family transcriptional regulator